MKEKEKLDKDKQVQEYVIKERKRVMGEIGEICSLIIGALSTLPMVWTYVTLTL